MPISLSAFFLFPPVSAFPFLIRNFVFLTLSFVIVSPLVRTPVFGGFGGELEGGSARRWRWF